MNKTVLLTNIQCSPSRFVYYSQGCPVLPPFLQEFSFSVGYERFAGPEIFFHPELYSPEFSTGLPELVDGAIQGCGIDSRRALYNNIVLSVRALACLVGPSRLPPRLTIEAASASKAQQSPHSNVMSYIHSPQPRVHLEH